MCAQVASVLWYLRFAIHVNKLMNIGVNNWRIYVEDAVNIPEATDASDSKENARKKINI